jgi:hypothetical protein
MPQKNRDEVRVSQHTRNREGIIGPVPQKNRHDIRVSHDARKMKRIAPIEGYGSGIGPVLQKNRDNVRVSHQTRNQEGIVSRDRVRKGHISSVVEQELHTIDMPLHTYDIPHPTCT